MIKLDHLYKSDQTKKTKQNVARLDLAIVDVDTMYTIIPT